MSQPTPKTPMTRRARLTLAAVATVLALPLFALLLLWNFDWNRARPWLNDKASQALGRPFAIRGELRLTWQQEAQPAPGWRGWIPWPHLVARDVHLGQPAAMGQGDMAAAQQLAFSLNPLALLNHEIAIPQLRFEQPQVALLRTADGRNNWTFPRSQHPLQWKLSLARVVFSQGNLQLDDAIEHIDASARVDTLNEAGPYGVKWQLDGHWRGQVIRGQGKTGAVLALQETNLPFPLQADATLGLIKVAAEGTLTNPAHLAGIDLQLKVGGASMARLYGLTGLLLPETPPFSTAGHLRGTLTPGASRWQYEHFTGRVGASDIAGDLAYEQRQPRGHLSGKVHAQLLQFADLGPMVGADSNASKTARGVAPVQPGDKVLPVEPFHTERWLALDADVGFRAEQIVRTKQLPLSKLNTELHLHDGVLQLTPLTFDIAGGSVNATVKLDGSGQRLKDAIAAELSASGRHIKLKQLFPTLPQMQATIGELNADTKLSATGNSVASLLASSNGELKTVVNDGTVSKLLLEQMGLNLGNVALAKLFGDKPVKLNCLAGDFGVNAGLAQTRSFIVDTEDATVHINGSVNLASEALDLTLRPDSKGVRIISLRSPIYVRGSFKHPDVAVDKGVLALRAGGAIALAALAAPAAALAPLISAGGKDDDNQCARLLAVARERPEAPPPRRPAKK